MTDKSAREAIATYLSKKVFTNELCSDGDCADGDCQGHCAIYEIDGCGHADAILAALEAGGFAVVPKEPTPEMLTAMHDAWDYFDANSDVFRREYKAAVAAANPKEEGK